MTKTKCLIATTLFTLIWADQASADFFVDSWVLSATCRNPFGFPSAYYTQVQNSPFDPPPLGIAIHNSAATAAFLFNWGLATGEFHIDANLASEGGDGGPFCGTDNRIDFHITQDTLVSIDSEWTHQFNGGIRTSTIRLWIVDAITDTSILTRGDTADTVAGDPPNDTVFVSDNILLPPGSYFVRSLMDLRAVGGSPNSVSTAHGFANIQMTTVPEPAALGPLAFAALLIRKPRRR